jgi:4-hydroxy-3-methylbut-2-en-1-yl diphosphate reductase
MTKFFIILLCVTEKGAVMLIHVCPLSGFCPGVARAIRIAEAALRKGPAALLGPLAHNDAVNGRLIDRGAAIRRDWNDHGDATRVIVTAHGAPASLMAALRAEGREVIDATCPLVRRVHQAAAGLLARDEHLVVMGRPDHREVRALTADWPSERFTVAETAEAACAAPDEPHMSVIHQTTFSEDKAAEAARLLAAKRPDARVNVVDTICPAVKSRRRALRRMARRVDAAVIVGSPASHNTMELARLAEEEGAEAVCAADASALDAERFQGMGAVCVAGGCSTPRGAVMEVARAIGRETAKEVFAS